MYWATWRTSATSESRRAPDQGVDPLQVVGDRGEHGQESHDSLIIPSLCRRNLATIVQSNYVRNHQVRRQAVSGAIRRTAAGRGPCGESAPTIAFDEVLLVGAGDGIKVGAPARRGRQGQGHRRGHGRGEKVTIFKMRRRKHYQKTQGHRQSYTEVRIDDIVEGIKPWHTRKQAAVRATGATPSRSASASRSTAASASTPARSWCASAARWCTPAPTSASGRDHTLFARVDGQVQYSRQGRESNKKTVVEHHGGRSGVAGPSSIESPIAVG